MKIKLDENMPHKLVELLSKLGHDVDTVPMEGLQGMEDGRVWEASQDEERFLITQDLDFSDIRAFPPGDHFGIMLVRLRMPGRESLLRAVHAVFSNEETENWSKCFVVLSEQKLRVVRPGS